MTIPDERALEPAELLDVLRAGRRDEFKSMLRQLPETTVDAAFEDASRDDRLEFLRLLPVERAAATFTDLALSEQCELLPDLPPDRLRLMGAFVGPDEVADLLGEIGADDAARRYLLSSLPPTLARSALELEQYPEDDAGGIMTPEYVALREGMTVAQALAFLRQASENAETVSNLYVVDAAGRLTGTVRLQALVTAPAARSISELSRHDPISARTDTDQEQVARLMRDYDLSSLPVVDEAGILKGIVTIDDVVDIIEEEATEDIYKGMAMEGSEIDYLRTSPVDLWRKRVFWLAALSLSEFLTVSVTGAYGSAIDAQPALAFFIAALIGTGGNTGSQSAILIVRAMAIGGLSGRDAWRVASKELATGLLLGVSLAAFAYVRIALFYKQPGIALTVSLAMLAIVVTANLVGGLLPMLFTRLKIDPAVTSSPFLATIMDATGLVIYFSIASLILRI